MFAFSVGDLVVTSWYYHAGQRGRVLKAELKAGYEYYLVALPEAETEIWLSQDSITLV